ncbi:hypothetical protein PLICRDRAFT_478587 [Plicaturopsis crispa FD-325 SS-3]|nr:hypothetical protein PLICRDRAFT_478587 [Plicaturopsis crispa FD-325 SS-3]
MNRHHPYGGGVGGYENAGARRGGAPAGPGPDRSYRFERGGAPSRGGAFSRGRGGGGNNRGSFEAPYGQGLYDQGSPTGDVGAGPYSNYNAGPPQDPFFQNGYGGGAPPQFGAPPIAAQPPLAGAYNQGYGSFEGALGN